MEGIGQGKLKISGVSCIGPPFYLWNNQGFNRHGQMNVGADSWYSRPIFYSGGGAGYSGRPEVEDTMYLYFPSKNEEDL